MVANKPNPILLADNLIGKSIGVSIGEPAGIGPDIILKTWQKRRSRKIPHFTVIGDVGVLEERNKQLGLSVPVIGVKNAKQAIGCENALAVISTKAPMECQPGIINTANSAGVIEAIKRGVKGIYAGEFSALTTCPINKKALYECGFDFPGHTEYLAHLAGEIDNIQYHPVMMLAGPKLRSVPVTIHIALSHVEEALDVDIIVQTARITAGDLVKKFGIDDPILAIAGVNPHAGEGGAMGREEIEIITPAIEILKSEGIRAVGPLPADTMFHKRARKQYDVAICMYHDQALIPAKILGFDDSINVTLGLPFIRTSPDHGSAIDLAGTGKAKINSFVAALKLAGKMAYQQKNAISSKHARVEY